MSHILASPRVKVATIAHIIPPKYLEALEQNQLISSCCRHPENHDIEAWYSCEAERDRGQPDIYILYCTCGRKHRRFCVGGNHPLAKKFSPEERPEYHDIRPVWTVR